MNPKVWPNIQVDTSYILNPNRKAKFHSFHSEIPNTLSIESSLVRTIKNTKDTCHD